MRDNLISIFSGFGTSLLAMITGVIQITVIIEVAIYGFIGGAVGFLGKLAVQALKTYCVKKFSSEK